MSVSRITEARDIVFAVLSESGPVAALTAGRIYPSKTPNGTVKPFVRVGVGESQPERFSGIATSAVALAVHLFDTERPLSPDPETATSDGVQVIADALDADPRIFVKRTMAVQAADEADDWHGMVFVEVTPFP